MGIDKKLIEKYNVPAPRYTSYPTVPYWQPVPPTQAEWIRAVQASYGADKETGISLYLHLPFCEDLCTFCACNKRITKNHAVESPYIETLIKEWDLYRKVLGTGIKIKEIHLGGGTPTFFAPENLRLLLGKIYETADLAPSPELSFEAHPRSTTYAHLQALRDMGFTRMSLGVQDISEKVNTIIHRKQSVADIIRATAEARSLGYNSINFDLVYGLPAQNKVTVQATLDLISELLPERIALYSFAFIPWQRPGQAQFTKHDLPHQDEKRLLYETAKEQLLGMGYLEIGMDHFALPTDNLAHAVETKTLHRNFMGYTPAYSRLSIALGCSGISDVWTAFAQNIREVEAYQKAVAQGLFPFFKGHLLTVEDLRVRAHILAIMCKLESGFTEDLGIWEAASAALAPMKEDGLWEEPSPYYLRVTRKGRAFLRNICMAFDLRLARAIPIGNLFSKSI